NEWKLKKILLDICMLPYLHTGEEINERLCSILAAFNITSKVFCTTTDRGSNIISVMQLLKENLVLKNNFHFRSCRCLAHILNFIVTASLLSIKSSIEKVHNFVNIISSLSSITQDFKELRQSISETYITMLTTIATVIRHNKNFHKFKLTLQEEANLHTAIQFLELFYETTNVLSGSTYTTLGISILLIDDIIDNILLYIHDSTTFIAAILDPQIKLELISNDMNIEANCSIFNSIFKTKYSNLILNSLPTNLEVPLNLIYTEQIAKDYLAVQSISVPSEQVFSKA
ncbi:11694_t:CDS:2, partial [Scutellospora calospora]